MSDRILQVQRREETGKNANRRLRADGKVPAVVYGNGLDSATIQVPTRKMEEMLRKTADENPIFRLELEGTDQKRHVIIKELHDNPMTGQLIHIDFLRVDMDEQLQATVSIEVHGTAVGVKEGGGILDNVTREVEISALPDKIPGHLSIDVSELEVGDHIEASQIELPDGVTLLEDPSRVIVSVQLPQRPAVDEDAEEEEAAEPIVLTAKPEDD